MKRLYAAALGALPGDCLRCGEGFYKAGYCNFCGVNASRPVRRIRRRVINGKYGRNSGTVNTSKNKGGR